MSELGSEFTNLAQRYWASLTDSLAGPETELVNSALDAVLEARHHLPALFNALVRTAPSPEWIAYVGTWFGENLYYGEHESPLPHLLKAQLSQEDLVRVLSGMYPEALSEMGLPTLAAGTLSKQQIHMLLGPRGPR